MINLFEELTEMGFDNLERVELFPAQLSSEKKGTGQKENKFSIEEVLYDKSYTCPVCHTVFKNKAIRSGRNKLIDIDLGLKARYDTVNPLIYECAVCERCGYAALARDFNHLTASQTAWIWEQVCTSYRHYHYPDILSEKDGILRYKMALLCSTVKKAKDGEKAYICLKIAWLYRDMNEKAMEEVFLKHALTGFENAYNNERFPIFELDELTAAYIIADIYRRLKEYSKAMKWLSFVIMDKSVSLRLKTKALQLKGVISQEKIRSKQK